MLTRGPPSTGGQDPGAKQMHHPRDSRSRPPNAPASLPAPTSRFKVKTRRCSEPTLKPASTLGTEVHFLLGNASSCL